MSEEGQPMESAENRRLTATGASAAILSAMREAEKQFSLTRAASMNGRGAKSNFLSVVVRSHGADRLPATTFDD